MGCASLPSLFFSSAAISSRNQQRTISKILLIYDMEGVSGVSHYEMTWVERPDDYARGREFLTSDVNAASRALAEPQPSAEASKRIAEAAKRAMEKFLKGAYRPYYLPPPYDFQLGFQNWQQANGAATAPGLLHDGESGMRNRSATFIEG